MSNLPGALPSTSRAKINPAAQKGNVEFIGELSAATYASLPQSFQAVARDLAARGEIGIQNLPNRASGR